MNFACGTRRTRHNVVRSFERAARVPLPPARTTGAGAHRYRMPCGAHVRACHDAVRPRYAAQPPIPPCSEQPAHDCERLLTVP